MSRRWLKVSASPALVIVLPSHSEGGELLVRHGGREVRLDLRPDDPADVAFAAFYPDCVHEVLPVSDGCRLTLIYNLLRRGRRGGGLEPPSYRTEQAKLADILRAWTVGDRPPPDAPDAVPEKLVYLLEHAYTQAGLGFAGLKGKDAAVAGVLAAAAQDARCELHLALLTIEEYGTAEYTGDYRRRGGRDEDELEAGEMTDRGASLSDWHTPEDELGPLPADEALELSPPELVDELAPDEESFEEATGNPGASYERTYRRAVRGVREPHGARRRLRQRRQ